MNVLSLILLFSMGLQVPDSVFRPENVLRISLPSWNFPSGFSKGRYVKIGYEPIFLLNWETFNLHIERNNDFQDYYWGTNKYFVSTPYFTLAHSAYGHFRNQKKWYVCAYDTLDIYFSYGRFIPSVSLLPQALLFKRDSPLERVMGLYLDASLVYFGTEGIVTYLGAVSSDVLNYTVSKKLFKAGVGVVNPQKFVSVGLYSNLVPEVALKALLPGGAYLDVYYGYAKNERQSYRYLYPEYAISDSFFTVMGKKFNLFLEKPPYALKVVYEGPDSLYNKNILVAFSISKPFFKLSYEYFKELDNKAKPFNVYIDDISYSVENKALSKGVLFINLPVGESVYFSPSLKITKITTEKDLNYSVDLLLGYDRKKFSVFFQTSGLLNGGNIEALDLFKGTVNKFYTHRRFRIGAGYSF